MKILIAAGIFPPEGGGPATYAKLISEELPKRGVLVSVLPYREVKKFSKILRHLSYTWMLFRASGDVDIIFAQDPVSVGLPSLIVSRLRGKKFFLRVGGDYAWEQGVQRFGVTDMLDDFVSKKKKYSLPVRIMKWIQSLVARNAEKIIVPGEYLKGIVETWGAKKENIIVVRNTFAPETFVSETKEELRLKLGFQGRVLITAARLVPWKGVKALIEIMSDIQKIFPDTTLFIAGSGPEKEYLENLSQENSNIIFLGNLPYETLFRYIKASDLFILNTGYEGFAHTLLEVMALGTPIVSTTAGGNPEIIESPKEGILVVYNDKQELISAIKKVFSNDEETKNMILRAKEKVSLFTKEGTVEGTHKVFI